MRSDMKQLETLEMHAQVQLDVWNFMKTTEFPQDYYEEIKFYFYIPICMKHYFLRHSVSFRFQNHLYGN